MNEKFENWLNNQHDDGLKDIKFILGGDTSNASVYSAESEIVRLHAMADAGIITDPPKAPNYSNELQELNSLLAK